MPESMMAVNPLKKWKMNRGEFEKLRIRHDFEFWAWRCVKIRHKVSGELVAFELNSAQRRVVGYLEEDRLAGRPMRLILLKARQWGGSTLIQMYMAWIQCVLKKGWNSLICAHLKGTAGVIRRMYATMLAHYPAELWDGGEKPALKSVDRAGDTRLIPGRDCEIVISSSMSQESSRGANCAMAHMSEVAFWMDSSSMSPEAFLKAVCGGIARAPLTLIALESTANGSGSFFHREWVRAKRGGSAMRAVFVAWHDIEMYREEVQDAQSLWERLDGYERGLWERGLTLEMIAWYHSKRLEMGSDDAMKAEYPSDDVEAFIHSGCGVFDPNAVERLRSGCREPEITGELRGAAVTGADALKDLRLTSDPAGCLKVWALPEAGHTYVTAVDVGGRSEGSDWSVAAVIDRSAEVPEVVAQWRGHADHDILGWKAAALSRFYNDSLLVVESNTLETESAGESAFILERLGQHCNNLYYRHSSDVGGGVRPGFHTNRASKALIIANLTGMVREGAYIERDAEACAELDTYRKESNGSYSARAGCHDDILMTRAIGLFVEVDLPSAPEKNRLKATEW